ncbi:MAG: T9SS type A sorting domain-containing protein [Bacteroidales bacterium]|nr:T9SS type A sorting domain-containing protein [Bacteroidales bacterium]
MIKVLRNCIVLLIALTLGKYSFGQHFTPPSLVYQPMNIIITATTIDGNELEAGDEIGVFDGDLCVGSIVLTGPVSGSPVFIVAINDDPSTGEVDGFILNNTIVFKIWDASASEEIVSVSANYTVTAGYTDVFTPWGSALAALEGMGAIQTSAQTLSACPGEVVVDIDVSNYKDVTTYSLNLEYDNSKVSYQSYQNLNSSLNQSALSVVNNGTSLSVQYNGTSATTLSDGTIFELVFDAINTTVAASSELIWSGSSVYYNQNGDELASGFSNGAINVNPLPATPATVNGSVDVCQGASTQAYSVNITNADSYNWTISPAQAGVLNGSGNSITIDFEANYSGTAVLAVKGINACGEGSPKSINIHVESKPSVSAGTDDTICENESFSLNAIASDFTNFTWSTSGDGSFDDATILNTVYTPGTNDKTNGSVILTSTATANSPCSGNVQDDLILTIQKSPLVDAGADAQICESDTYTLSAVSQDYNSFQWSTSGDGSFNNVNLLSAIYTPGALDILSGSVILTAIATANTPCIIDAQESLVLTIQKSPELSAGDDASICATDTYTLNGAAANHTTAIWTTVGDGSFNNAALLNAVYTPGITDKTNGSVELTLTATSTAPCTESSDDVLILSILTNPTINAGTNLSICENGNAELLANGNNYESVFWTTAGDGSFDDNGILNAVYTPGANDLVTGSITLSIEAVGAGSCLNASDDLIIDFAPEAQAFAGSDATICESETITITSATANNYATLLWATDGDGTFDNATILTPVYTPGANDIINGTVELTLSAQSQNPCTDAVNDVIIISIQKEATIDAGADFDVCESGAVNLNASATQYSSVVWTTSGNGCFDDASLFNAVYSPGSEDLNNGYCNLTLTAQGITPCASSVNDVIQVTLSPDAIVDAGTDITICESGTVQLAGLAENYQSVLWTTAGDGSFDDDSILNAVYTPGANDMLAGTITLSLIAEGQTPCDTQAEDQVVITLQPNVVVNAGDDAAICATDTYMLSGVAENHTAVNWTTAGDGSFDNANILNAVYTPGANDKTVGSVELKLTTTAIAPCSQAVEDVMTLSILTNPIIDAGIDLSICENGNAQLLASGHNYESILWTTAGDGSFDDNSILNAVYTPGAADLTAGSVILNIEGFAAGSCEGASDNMVVSLLPLVQVDAGDDKVVCYGSDITLSDAAADNYNALLWTTAGDGTFDNAILLNPSYTPGANDLLNGSVELTLQAESQIPCTDLVSDVLILSILENSTADAGTDADVCQGMPFEITDASATDFGSIIWTTSGDGSFNDNTLMNPVYTAGSTDAVDGTVTLTMTVNAASPCSGQLIETKVLSVMSKPQVDAGSNTTICENETVQFSVTANYYTSILWSTSGDGSFNNATTLITVYTPGPADIASGSAIITVTGEGYGVCTTPATDQVTLSIQYLPTLEVGDDMDICEGETCSLQAVTQNYSSVQWTSSGDGSFSDNTSLTSIYTPGSGDVTTGSVALTLIVNSELPCDESVQDVVNVSIQSAPEVDAGDDFDICEDETVSLNANAQNYNGFIWTTSGDGIFSNITTLTPIYTPGVGDVTNGSVVITLQIEGTGACNINVSDAVTINITQAVTVDAGDDISICSDEDAVIFASCEHASSILWTSSGDGTFSNANIEDPVYTPGSNDIASGSVTLIFTAQPNSPCTTNATDNISVVITTGPEQPEQPTGDDQILIEYNNPQVYGNYQVSNQVDVDEYIWEVEPVGAGVVVVNGSNEIEVEWLPTYGPDYAYVKVKTVNDCGVSEYSETFEVFVDNHVGVDQYDNQTSIQLSPNPGNGLVTITTQGLQKGDYIIKVIDNSGRCIAQEQMTIAENNTQLDLRSCADGTYHIYIFNDNFSWSGQLVICK